MAPVIQRWGYKPARFFPPEKITSEGRVGGAILLDGEADGIAFRDHGVIHVLSRLFRFRYSYWSDNHKTEHTPENRLMIDYELSEQQQGTKLSLEQSNLRSEEMFRVMAAVWDDLLDNLARYVENRA